MNAPNPNPNTIKTPDPLFVNKGKARETEEPVAVVKDNEKALLDRQVGVPKKDGAVTRRRHWESTHISVEINGSDKKKLSEREVSSSLKHYSTDQLPWPDEHHSYFKDKDGDLVLKKNGTYEGGVAMTMYGINSNQIPQYVTELRASPEKKSLHHREAFATASKKGIAQKFRDTYPIETYSACQGVPQDRGHGIDFIVTIPEDKHSSIESSNFTPQNSVYNRQVRNLLVGKLIRELGMSFKEINIYRESPFQLIQEIGGKYTISKTKEKHSIDVPEGFLFFVFNPLKKIKHIYYFPNFIDYKALKEAKNISYTQVPDIFEIEVPTQKLFDREINMYGVNVYGEEKTDEDVSREVHIKSYIGFRMILGRYEVLFKKVNEANKWIPAKAKEALERTLALKQLNEMAESEFISIDKRLRFIETLLTEMRGLEQTHFGIVPALYWLKRVEEQVAIESTLEEKLQLHDTYLFIKNSHPKIYDNLVNNIKVNENELLIKILNQFDEEGGGIEETLLIAGKVNEGMLRQIYLEKAEKHIMTDLKKIRTDEGITALEELHNLADYYSGLYSGEQYGITVSYGKALDLYQMLLTKFSKKIDFDAVLYAKHFKEIFMESPESVSYQHRCTYVKFFKQVGFKEEVIFWETKVREYMVEFEELTVVSDV